MYYSLCLLYTRNLAWKGIYDALRTGAWTALHDTRFNRVHTLGDVFQGRNITCNCTYLLSAGVYNGSR